MIGIIAALLVTGVAAYGLGDAGNGSLDNSNLAHSGDHSKTHKNKNVDHEKDKKSDSKSDITVDITMQQNVNNYLFNIPTAFILDVDEYNENTYTYNKIFLPDGDEYDWEVDLEILEFDQATGNDLTQEDVESYAPEGSTETTINGITGYYSQDGDWETFVFGSGNEIITLQVYGISLEVVLDGVTQEPLVGDTEVEEDSTDDSSDDSSDEDSDDSTYDDSSYDDSSYDDSSYDDSSYDDSSYDDSSYDDSSYDDSYYDDSSYDDEDY